MDRASDRLNLSTLRPILLESAFGVLFARIGEPRMAVETTVSEVFD